MSRFRTELAPSDAAKVALATAATGFFSQEETEIARELAQEAYTRGHASGYHFILAEEAVAANESQEAELIGFACFGPVPATQSSYDLYWIVVTPTAQRRGLGRALLQCVEEAVMQQGGRRLYADTSSRLLYAPTRRFYERTGFAQAAHLEDFYADGDGKVIYRKVLTPAGE